ncbi:MAG TPA: trigger factor [Gammaproteobacteria bacterium]|nr:trigger factor [Gammaproteobacteria bacterium]
MQVSVESTGDLGRRMTVEVPEDRIRDEVNNRLKRLAKTTKMDGFRPGKVPLSVVKGRYGDQVRQEVIGEVMQSTFYEAVNQESLRPAGLPNIEPTSIEEGNDLAYTATFEVFPEIELPGMEGLEIEKPTAEVTEADVDKMIDTLKQQHTEYQPVDRPAQENDRVRVDFHGTIDGEEFNGNSGEDVPLTLGGGRLIEGFEDGVIGASAGETRSLDLTFPEDYPYNEVAGKPVHFEVTVKQVEAPEEPEVDDAFAAKFGVTEGGIEAFRKEVRDNMERELSQNLQNQVKQRVLDKVLEVTEIDIPQSLVDQEAQTLANQMKQQMHVPEGKEGPDLDTSMFQDQAARRVKLGLVLSELVRANGLTADPNKVRERVETIASSYEQPEEVVNWYYADRSRLQDVETVVLEDTVVDWILGQADVKEQTTSFEEVMNEAQQA